MFLVCILPCSRFPFHMYQHKNPKVRVSYIINYIFEKGSVGNRYEVYITVLNWRTSLLIIICCCRVIKVYFLSLFFLFAKIVPLHGKKKTTYKKKHKRRGVQKLKVPPLIIRAFALEQSYQVCYATYHFTTSKPTLSILTHYFTIYRLSYLLFFNSIH